MACFERLLTHSDSVFCVLSHADATGLYVSPNVSRVFNSEPSQLVGCARRAARTDALLAAADAAARLRV
jgi:hypothetical protein